MATSPPPPDGPPTTVIDTQDFQSLWGNLAIANNRDENVSVRIRRLRDSVFMDCTFVAADPTSALSRDLFGPAEFWDVGAGRAFGLESWRAWDEGTCDAFLIDGSGLSQHLVFLDTDTYPLTTMGSTTDTVDLDRALFIEPDQTALGEHPAVFTAPPLIAPEPSSSCETVSEEAALAWSDPPAMSIYSIDSILEAPDGCMELTLGDASGGSFEWFLCVPRGTFHFQEGEEVLFDTIDLGEDFGSVDGIELLSASEPNKKLRVARGQDFVPFNATTTLSVEETEGCGYAQDDCGNLTRPLTALYGGPSGVKIGPGEAVMLEEQSYLYIVRAHDIPVGDLECLADAIQADRLIESIYVSN